MIWLVLIVTSVYAILGQDIVPLIIIDAEDYSGFTAQFRGLQVLVNTVASSKFHWRHNGHKIDENYKPAFYDPYATRLIVAVKSTIEYAGIYQFYMETPVGTITGRNATVEFTYLGDFTAPSSPEDVREVVVGQAAFIKCPAHTRGHNFIYKWGKTAIVGGVNFVKSAPNYIVLNNGTLFFSHLKKEDVKYFNMQEAKCGMEVNSEYLNRFKWAHLPTQFRNVSENFTKFGPKIVTSLPNRMYVLDDTITLVCAATGNPVPIYTWKKIDSEGNEKDIVDNQDGYMFENKDTRILVIEKAQVSHSGRYRCTATIGQKSDTNEGELRYHIKPEWVLPKIASVKVSIYSSHSWQCNATSHPLPRYKWYVNGTELADSPEHRIIGGNITFPRLKKKQSGMYECFAANELDNIHQTAYLEVKAPKCNVSKMNLMFLVDGSGSVPPNAFKEFKRFMQLLVKKFVVGPEATHVGVLQYSSKVRTGPEFAIGEHETMEAVQGAISKVRYHYGAYTFGGYAMRMAKELMDDYNRRDAKNVMVFLMDDGTWDKRLARKLSKTLRNSGTQIIILDLQKMKIMHDIADKGLEFTTEKLEENVEEVATEICA